EARKTSIRLIIPVGGAHVASMVFRGFPGCPAWPVARGTAHAQHHADDAPVRATCATARYLAAMAYPRAGPARARPGPLPRGQVGRTGGLSRRRRGDAGGRAVGRADPRSAETGAGHGADAQ